MLEHGPPRSDNAGITRVDDVLSEDKEVLLIGAIFDRGVIARTLWPEQDLFLRFFGRGSRLTQAHRDWFNAQLMRISMGFGDAAKTRDEWITVLTGLNSQQ